MQKCDCKICVHGEVYYIRDRRNPESPMKSSGRVMCAAPKYRGRKFIVKEKTECDAFKGRERHNAQNGG